MQQSGENKLLRNYHAGECTPEEQAMIAHHIIYVHIMPQNGLEMQPDPDRLRSGVVGPQIKSRTIIRLARVAAASPAFAILTGVRASIFATDKNPPAAYANNVDTGSDRTLVYKVASKSNTSGSNTITTSTTLKGGKYKIVLAGGIRKWPDAASSLTYSTAANVGRGERNVNVVAEAYFEVNKVKPVVGRQKKIRKMPFIVKTDKQELIVLGTHVNINSYTDEPGAKTSPLDGAICISAPHGKKGGTILGPGDEGISDSSEIKVNKVDINEVIGWKNGEFFFSNESLEVIMQNIARWYNVDIKYADEALKTKTFGLAISRYSNISEVLQVLEQTGEVHFKVNGRQIIAMK